MSINKTLEYYNLNADSFSDQTVNVDFSIVQNKFLNKISESSYILDFGCGSGRDTKYFLEKGHIVDAIDGSEKLCRLASEYTGICVKHMYFQELDEVEKYDAIWACSSILHLSNEELSDVLEKMSKALKDNGLVYTSFKNSDFEGVRNGRYFTDMTEGRLDELLKKVDSLIIEELWITSDVRPGRGEEKWLNVFLRKK